MWTEFNNAWLTLFQKQKDLTQEFLHVGAAPRHPQSLIPREFLWKMSKELVRLSDSVEKHGLVDYQLGIWEENIMNSKSLYGITASSPDILIVLLECLDLLDGPDEDEADLGRPQP